MFFTAEYFSHPQKFEEVRNFEARLNRRFELEASACYQSAGLPMPFLADHVACAHVLSKACKLLEEIEDGLHSGLVDSRDCSIETAADFLGELKRRV